MSAAKHTPGPWQVDYPDCWGGVFVESTDAANGRPLIASLYERESAFPPDDDERRANALLIAAAPELLEALKFICRAADDVEAPGYEQTMRRAFEMAHAAIDKATG